MDAQARPEVPDAWAVSLFFGDDRRIVVDLAPDARLDVTLSVHTLRNTHDTALAARARIRSQSNASSLGG
jgi:hypothetical protein